MYPLVLHLHAPLAQLIVPGEAAAQLSASSDGPAPLARLGGCRHQDETDAVLDTALMQQSVAQLHDVLLDAAQGAAWTPAAGPADGAGAGPGSPQAHEAALMQQSAAEVHGALGAARGAVRSSAASLGGAYADVGGPMAHEDATALAAAARELVWRVANPLTAGGGMVWVLLMTMCVVVPCLALCVVRQLERLVPATTSRRPSLMSRPSSSSSLGSCVARKPKPKPKAAISDDEALPSPTRRSAPPSARSARGTPFARSLSQKIMGSRSASKGSCASSLAAPVARELPCRPSASLVVSVDCLVDVGEAGGSLSVVDTLGGPGLSLALSQSAEGARRLLIFAAGNQEEPCASVEPLLAPQGGPASMELRGAGGAHAGRLTPQANGTFAVHAEGQPQLIIAGDEDSLNLEVTSRDGCPVAVVGCRPISPGGLEHVEIDIFQVSDTQLVVSCIFAILFLCGESIDE